MTKFTLFLAILSMAIFSSCSKSEISDDVLPTPEVEYTTSNAFNDDSLYEGEVDFAINNPNSQVFENEALLLTNSSKNAISYQWDFGNGDTSEEANPNYTYPRHGIFTVKLAITDKNSNIHELSHDVTVICLFDGGIHDNN